MAAIPTITAEGLQTRLAQLNHAFFSKGAYNLNIVGIRSADLQANEFNDRLLVCYREVHTGPLVIKRYAITTDPGVYYRETPMRAVGTGIMAPGQYRGAYKLGTHKGYPALQQVGPIGIYRDKNHDDQIDITGPVSWGIFGGNIHRASATKRSVYVNKWSALCQVFADPNEFEAFLGICRKSIPLYGNKFTYTLLDAW